MEISLCMIVKNEEATLGRCLQSICDIVDEIIIADTGSEDSTKNIAFKYTDKVFDFIWIDDFSAARNFAFSKATKDLILWLDADDIFPERNKPKLIDLKNNFPNVNVVYMPYDIAFDEDGKATFTYYRERLVRKAANPVWIEPVHEVISIKGPELYTDISIEHRKIKANPNGRNLKIMEKQLANGKGLSPRLTFYYARELMYNGKVKKAIKIFNEFLNNDKGWFENKICACNDLSLCYENIGQSDKALETALKGLSYSKPRSKTLCRIGELFLKKNRPEEAKYWYEAASNCPQEQNLGFGEPEYNTFIPAIQLCVIYDRLGDPDKAEYYNEIAGSYKPHSPAYQYNREYFKTKRG